MRELSQRYKQLSGCFLVGGLPDFTTAKTARITATKSTLLGMRLLPTSPVLRHHLALPEGAGLVVDRVLPTSRAAQLGLRKHDILVKMNGIPVDTADQLRALHKASGTLDYVRRGKPQTLDLAKAPKPAKKLIRVTK